MTWYLHAEDSLSDTNGTDLQDHVGESATWTRRGPYAVTIQDGELVTPASGSFYGLYSIDGLNLGAEQRISSTIEFSATSFWAGLVGGWDVDEENYYSAVIAPGTDFVSLGRVQGGVAATLDFDFPSLPNSGVHTVELVLSLGLQQLFVDGVEILATTDSVLDVTGTAGVMVQDKATTGTTILSVAAYSSEPPPGPPNTFYHAAGTLTFATAPDRSSSRDLGFPQVSGRDSAGNVYVYRKGAKRRLSHRLSWPRVTTSERDSLITFHGTTVLGIRTAFTWYDHAGTAHTVHFAAAQISHHEVAPGRHAVNVELIEEVAL